MTVTAGLSLLMLLALQVAAQERTVYFGIGGSLSLNPEFSEAITSITWKHKGNIVAEYIKNAVPLEYLGDLKTRANLDLTTGILTISNMGKPDDGHFTVEINNRVLPVRYNAEGIRKLDDYRVEVIVRPLTCSSSSDSCTLVCDGDFTGAGPVSYSWKKGETGEWKEAGNTIPVINEEEKKTGLGTFTCRANNPFSEKESRPLENPFRVKETDSTVAVAAGVAIPLVVIGLLAGGFVIYKKYFEKGERPAQAEQRNGEKASGDEGEADGMMESAKAANSQL